MKKKRALVVDDDSQILSITGRWLRRAGYDVELANSFEDARVAIELSAPDIVVSDIRLGEFNGIHVGILARKARPDVRLIMISGWDDPVLRHHASQLDASYIQKPLHAATFLSAVAADHAL